MPAAALFADDVVFGTLAPKDSCHMFIAAAASRQMKFNGSQANK